LASDGDELATPARSLPDVLETQVELRLTQVLEPHPDDHLIECGELGKVVTGAVEGDQAKVAGELGEDLRGVVAEEELPAAALPA